TLQNMPHQPTRIAGLSIASFDTGPVPAKFDLELSVSEVDGALTGSLVYATDLFDDTTIARLISHVGRLLEGIVAEPDRRGAGRPGWPAWSASSRRAGPTCRSIRARRSGGSPTCWPMPRPRCC